MTLTKKCPTCGSEAIAPTDSTGFYICMVCHSPWPAPMEAVVARDDIKDYARRSRLHEREECARIAELMENIDMAGVAEKDKAGFALGNRAACQVIARAIRRKV